MAVASVALGTFTLVTNEFLPVGMLSVMAPELGVSEGVAGLTMTIPGIVAAVAAPTLTVLGGRVDRRIFLIAMSALFVASDLIAAASGSITVLLAARFLLGLGIGGFWAIGAGIGAQLVGAARAIRATTIIFAGVSIASVIGVPVGALISAHWGWRMAFVTTAGLGVVVLASQIFLLPRMKVDEPTTWKTLADVLRGRNARVGLIATILVVVGQFTAYTYVGPFLERETGADPNLVSGLLLAYGVAGIVGNFAVGGLLRKRMLATVVTTALLLAASVLLLPAIGGMTVAAGGVLLVWGLAYGAIPVAMQTWVFTSDTRSAEGGTALYIASFQISVAAGSFVGGRIVDGYSTALSMVAGAVLAAAGAVVLLVFSNRTPASDPSDGPDAVALRTAGVPGERE
ncbi:MFS transporter [Herbiconiux sp. P17]|uniref:MFS transporter n=1 Tax=Herbiconiux wuyangfengii TaxID=3342794 RepID=UPI0035B6FC83